MTSENFSCSLKWQALCSGKRWGNMEYILMISRLHLAFRVYKIMSFCLSVCSTFCWQRKPIKGYTLSLSITNSREIFIEGRTVYTPICPHYAVSFHYLVVCSPITRRSMVLVDSTHFWGIWCMNSSSLIHLMSVCTCDFLKHIMTARISLQSFSKLWDNLWNKILHRNIHKL